VLGVYALAAPAIGFLGGWAGLAAAAAAAGSCAAGAAAALVASHCLAAVEESLPSPVAGEGPGVRAGRFPA